MSHQILTNANKDCRCCQIRSMTWQRTNVSHWCLHVTIAFWLTSLADCYSSFEDEHRLKRHKAQSTSNEIIKAIENIDNENLIETSLQIVKKILSSRSTTQSNNENHDVENVLIKSFAIDDSMSRFSQIININILKLWSR